MSSINTKHPAGFWYTAFAYAVMSFGFGILNSLLVLYLTERMHFSQGQAYMLFAAFNALLYTLPVYSGYLTGQFGYKRSLLVGAALNVVALIVIAVPQRETLYLGLALYAAGASLASPAFLVLLGKLYGKNDVRREGSFTLFYVIFNISYLFSAIVGGYTEKYFGFAVSFIIAAVIAAVTFIFYFLGRRTLIPYPGRNIDPILEWPQSKLWIGLVVAILIPVLPCLWLLQHAKFNNELLMGIGLLVSIGMIVMALRQKDAQVRLKLIAFILLSIISIGFFSLYMLEPSLITIFIKDNVQRNVWNFHHIPPSVYYGLDPFFIVILGSAMSWLWIRLRLVDRDPSLPTKFSASIFIMAVGFLLFALAIAVTGYGNKVNSAWVVLAYLFLTIAELLISPIGLAMVGRLSPERSEGLLMGVWQVFIGFSAAVSGYLAQLAKVPEHGALAQTNPIYQLAFFKIGTIALLLGLLSLLTWPFLKKAIGSKPVKNFLA